MNDIGKRIIVIGSPGSGKSTFSRKLAEVTGIPLIHLDKEFWNHGWVETPREEWVERQANFISEDEWIIDGNYGGTLDIRLEKADTIICFQLSRMTCLLRYLKRVITNMNKIRPDMPEGCPEHLDFEFMQYIWNFPRNSGKRNLERINNCKNKHVIFFNKKNDANKYINILKNRNNKL
jgi:adenylate kinase family enzyme